MRPVAQAAADDARRARIRVLSAIGAAAADPVRLLAAVQEAADDEDALRRVGEAFSVDEDLSQVLLDLRVGQLSGAFRSRVADELRLLGAEWGAPVEASLTVPGRRHGVLTVEGAEHRLRAGGWPALFDAVHAFLRDEVARPLLRPVVLTGGEAAGGPARWTVWPDGSGRAEDAGHPL
ncbi:MAG: hypothetical protein ACLGI3_17760 [Actinomycetes bacterium]